MDAVLHCRETQVSRRAATGTRSSLEIHVGLVSLVRPGSRDIKFRTIPFEGQHPLFESEADFRWRLVVSLKEWQPASPCLVWRRRQAGSRTAPIHLPREHGFKRHRRPRCALAWLTRSNGASRSCRFACNLPFPTEEPP